MVAILIVLTVAVAISVDAVKVYSRHAHDQVGRHTMGIHHKPHHVGS